MFGYVTANCSALSQAELDRYRACYCGVCRAIAARYGTVARAFVSYDLTFLVLLRSALDEAEETERLGRCPTHPLGKIPSWSTSWTDYCADLNILLAWHSADDSVRDGRRLSGGTARGLLDAAFRKAEGVRPREAALIRSHMESLRQIQQDPAAGPDAAAGEFGAMLGELFETDGGRWKGALHDMGDYLGRFLYMADAVTDLKRDLRTGNYNPLKKAYEAGEREFSAILNMLMANCTRRFEVLPIVQDVDILRNVLYSGVWQKLTNTGLSGGKKEQHE